MKMYRSLTLTWTRERANASNPNAGAHAYRPEDKDDGPNTETQLSSVCGQIERAEREDTSDEKEEPAKDPTEAWRILDKKLVDASQNRTICRSFGNELIYEERFILRKTARALNDIG